MVSLPSSASSSSTYPVTEEGDDVLAWRFPTADLEIEQGAALIVRDTQAALFVDEVASPSLRGGRYVLARETDRSSPTFGIGPSSSSPLQERGLLLLDPSRVGQTFGPPSPSPFAIAVRLGSGRPSGSTAPDCRARTLPSSGLGHARRLHRRRSRGQLRACSTSALAAHLGTSDIPFLDMAANQADLAIGVRRLAQQACEPLGTAMEDVQIESLTLPDDCSSGSTSASAWPWSAIRALHAVPDRALDPARGRGGGGGAAGAGWVSVPASRWGRRWGRRDHRAPCGGDPEEPAESRVGDAARERSGVGQ